METVYCEGGPLDGQLKSVSKSMNHFNVTVNSVISHYERTGRKVKGYVVFYSDPDWDR